MTTRQNISGMPESLKAFLANEFPSEQTQLAQVWDLSGGAKPESVVDEHRKQEIRRHVMVEANRSQRRSSREPMRLFLFKSYAVAAVILILVSLGFLLSPTVNTLHAPLGTVSPVRFELEDGSSVMLAAGSSLSYTSAFGESTRRVSLRGEAFFDVASDGSAFVVETYNARTQVLGTRFSVRAWPRELEAQTEVKVEEGHVSVSPRQQIWSVVLEAGEAASVLAVVESNASKASIDMANAFNWTRGGYEYRNEPVGNVLADLERRFDLLITAPRELQLRPISIFNQSEGILEEILGDISATIGVRYRRIAGGYELYTS